MNSKSLQNFGMKLSKVLLIAATVLMALFALLTLFRLAVGFWIYAAVENWVTTRLGFDYYAAQLLTVICVLALNAVFPALSWYLVLGKKKIWGIAVFIAVPAIMFLLVSTVGNSVCFDRRTGKPLCYYADTPNGRVWSRTPGYDPESGTQFNLFTKEIMEREAAEKRKANEQQLKKKEESENFFREISPRREPDTLNERQTYSSQEKTEQPEGQAPIQQPVQEELPTQQDENQIAQTKQEREALQQELERQQQESERMRQQLLDQQKQIEEERKQQQENLERGRAEQERQRIEAEKQHAVRAADERRKQEEETQRRKAERNKAILDLINKGVDIYARRRRN